MSTGLSGAGAALPLPACFLAPLATLPSCKQVQQTWSSVAANHPFAREQCQDWLPDEQLLSLTNTLPAALPACAAARSAWLPAKRSRNAAIVSSPMFESSG
jgi:hypothetical protein